MDRLNNNIKNEKGKHLTYEKRIKIEALSKAGMKSEEIGRQIGCSGRTVRRGLQKGMEELLNSDFTTRKEYSADIGQQKHEYAGTGKGAWVNSKTGETLHPDLNHGAPHGPHWDYNYPGGGNGFRIYPNGSMTPKMFVGGILYA